MTKTHNKPIHTQIPLLFRALVRSRGSHYAVETQAPGCGSLGFDACLGILRELSELTTSMKEAVRWADLMEHAEAPVGAGSEKDAGISGLAALSLVDGTDRQVFHLLDEMAETAKFIASTKQGAMPINSQQDQDEFWLRCINHVFFFDHGFQVVSGREAKIPALGLLHEVAQTRAGIGCVVAALYAGVAARCGLDNVRILGLPDMPVHDTSQILSRNFPMNVLVVLDNGDEVPKRMVDVSNRGEWAFATQSDLDAMLRQAYGQEWMDTVGSHRGAVLANLDLWVSVAQFLVKSYAHHTVESVANVATHHRYARLLTQLGKGLSWNDSARQTTAVVQNYGGVPDFFPAGVTAFQSEQHR